MYGGSGTAPYFSINSAGSQRSAESDAPHPTSQQSHDLRGHTLTEEYLASHLEFSTRVGQAGPGSIRLGVDQQDLGVTPVVPLSFQSGGYYATHVRHQHVTRVGKCREGRKRRVFDCTGVAVQDKQTTGATVRERSLCNSLGRIFVVEVVGAVATRFLHHYRRNSPAVRCRSAARSRSACMPPGWRPCPAVYAGGSPAESSMVRTLPRACRDPRRQPRRSY